MTAALHSTRPTNLTSPAHAGALRPPDVRALYEVVQMLVGSRALNSSNADKLKLIVRVAARPVLYAISQLRRAQANLFVPSVQLLPHAEAPHKLCGTLSAKLVTPWVALVSGGVLYAASKEWWKQVHAADAARLLLLAASLPSSAARDVPVYLPKSQLASDHVPGTTNYRLVTVQLSAKLELLVLSTSGNPTLPAARRMVRDVCLKHVGSLAECMALPTDQCPDLTSIHPALTGHVLQTWLSCVPSLSHRSCAPNAGSFSL